jgi:hypothetical protein
MGWLLRMAFSIRKALKGYRHRQVFIEVFFSILSGASQNDHCVSWRASDK